jgi:hypothetical protein
MQQFVVRAVVFDSIVALEECTKVVRPGGVDKEWNTTE